MSLSQVKGVRCFEGAAFLQNVENRVLDPIQWRYDVATKCLEPLAQRYNGISQGTRICVCVVVMYRTRIDELQILPFLVKYTFYISYWKFAKTSYSTRHLPHRTPKLFSYCHCLCFHRHFQAIYCHWTADMWAVWLWMELIFSFEIAGIELNIIIPPVNLTSI